MADKKETTLSIVIRTVDKATAAIRAINARIAGLTAPVRAFSTRVIGGLKGVGSAIAGVLSKVPLIGGVIVASAGAAVAGLMKLVDGFDSLGDKAEAIGVGVDFLAQMRYAAERSGASVEELDAGLQGFSKSLGEARAGTGRMAAFLTKVSPALLRQLKATKSNEEAFDLMADAMQKLEDPAKKAALAQKIFGSAALAPLLARGSKGVQDLRNRYLELAGSQKEAAEKSGEVDDAMKDLRASTDGIKAALVTGLAPALKVIVERLRNWFVAHRDDIAQWAADLGEKIPGALQSIVAWFGKVVEKVESAIGKVKALYDGIMELRREVFGPSVAERTEELYKRTAGSQKRVLTGASRETLLGRAAQLRQEASNLYTKPGGFTEDDEVTIKLNERLAADLDQMAEAKLFPAGPSLDMERFKKRYAMAAPDRFEKYDVQFLEPIAEALVRTPALREITDAIADAERARPDVSGQARGARAAASSMDAARSTPEAKIVVDFVNAPKGMRANTDPRSTASVDLSVGSQMYPGGL